MLGMIGNPVVCPPPPTALREGARLQLAPLHGMVLSLPTPSLLYPPIASEPETRIPSLATVFNLAFPHTNGSSRPGSPPKPKKIRSQTLDAIHALEIFAQRPLLRPKTFNSRKLAGELAKKYSVAPNTIRDIWNRRSWARVTQPLWTELEAKSAPGAISMSWSSDGEDLSPTASSEE
jgi:hypothetical protein